MASDCGGMEVLFLEQHEEKYYKYMCVICRLIPRDVHQANCCGKFMCEKCYVEQRRRHGQCPSCRASMNHTVQTVFRDRNRQQEILSLKVYCYNKNHGCSWTGELLYLERDHGKLCTFKLVVCQECKDKVPETMMSAHLSERCLKRAYKCPHCNKMGVYEDIITKHLEECPECPINCLNNSRGCPAKLKKKEMELHRKVCQFELVSCRYQSLGCNIAVTRLEKEGHECMCQYKPAEDLHVALLTHSHSTLQRQNVLPLHVCIDKFSARWENKEVWQQDFFTEQTGYYMCLKVYLNHCTPNYLSCFIHLKAGPHDEALCWPFKGIFEIELLNQKEDRNHYMKEIKFITSRKDSYNMLDRQTTECIVGLGEPQYMAQCDLLGQYRTNCQYLQDDKVLLRVSVKSAESSNKFWPCYGGLR